MLARKTPFQMVRQVALNILLPNVLRVIELIREVNPYSDKVRSRFGAVNTELPQRQALYTTIGGTLVLDSESSLMSAAAAVASSRIYYSVSPI